MANWITVEDSLKGRARAVEREQERIIKLLETMQETALATDTDEGTQTAWVLENAIVLIKVGANG
jgi:hypothetical protein